MGGYFPHRGGTGYGRERKVKHLDQKLQGKFEKRNRHTMSKSVVDDAKVEVGDKGRLRKTLEQLRKERDEENEVRAFLEEMQQNL